MSSQRRAQLADRPRVWSRQWLREELRYTWWSLRLWPVGADLRSRAWLSVLGSPIVARLRSGPVHVRIRLANRVFAVTLRERVELAVLHEVAIVDEYGGADDLPARTIVDLGAHIGLATLRLIGSHPTANVVAVEADPLLVERLRANVDGLPVTVVHAAVGAHASDRPFYRSDDDSWSNSLTRTLTSQEEVTVPSITFDELLERYGLDEVDLLKIDIEGGEWEVLADGLPACVKAVVGEFHADRARPPAELLGSVAGEMDVEVIRSDDERLAFFARRR